MKKLWFFVLSSENRPSEIAVTPRSTPFLYHDMDQLARWL